MIDLHVHSTFSDGTLTPSQLVNLAMEKGLRAFALTDHDTTDGLSEALQYAAHLSDTLPTEEQGRVPMVIPGIELASDISHTEVHVVGLFINPENETFRQYLIHFVESRTERNKKISEKFKEFGIDISYEMLLEYFPNSVITRAHYARYLKEKGYVQSNQEAFDKYLDHDRPCYVPREKITPVQAVELVLAAGGIPVLAHPILYHLSDARLDDLVRSLKDAGLVAIEALYSSYTAADERQIRKLAQKYELLLSGGSDFHGANKPAIDMGTGYGKLYIPDDILTDLIAKHKSMYPN